MKKLATILICAGCLSVSAAAQQTVRIGKLEFSVKKSQDTTAQLSVDESVAQKASYKKFHKSTPYMGIGFIQPNIGGDLYTTLGGKSINLDFGWLHRYQFSRRFALLLTCHYSYYNYKLHDAASEPLFRNEVIGTMYAKDEIKKQMFRSHNAAVGGLMRFYIVTPNKRRNDGIFVDLGVQGDWAFSKYYNLYTRTEKKKHINDYAFNAFPVSAVARVGWRGSAIFVRYRLTDAFNQKALPMDLPKVTIGINFL